MNCNLKRSLPNLKTRRIHSWRASWLHKSKMLKNLASYKNCDYRENFLFNFELQKILPPNELHEGVSSFTIPVSKFFSFLFVRNPLMKIQALQPKSLWEMFSPTGGLFDNLIKQTVQDLKGICWLSECSSLDWKSYHYFDLFTE